MYKEISSVNGLGTSDEHPEHMFVVLFFFEK